MFLRWLLFSLSLLVVSELLPGFHIASFWVALVVALVVAILNLLVRPVLLLVTLPINLLTLGLFTFVVNGLVLWIANLVVKGFTIDNFSSALAAAFIMWLFNLLIYQATRPATPKIVVETISDTNE